MPKPIPKPKRVMNPWTEQEIAMLRRMAKDGLTWRGAAAILGTHPEQGVRQKAIDLAIEFKHRHTASDPRLSGPIPKPVEPRNTSTLTAFIMGDPIPGRSALEQKQNRV